MPRSRPSDITSKVVGTEIRSSRRELALTQSDVAARLGVSTPYVANVEAGRENLTLGQLAAIADALGTELAIAFPVKQRARVTLPE